MLCHIYYFTSKPEHFPPLCDYLGPKGDDAVRETISVPGDPGMPGKAGERGEPGELGPKGLRGPKGTTPQTQCSNFLWCLMNSSCICIIPYLLGAQGQKGDAGAKGDVGKDGSPGPRGDTGPQGDQGKS